MCGRLVFIFVYHHCEAFDLIAASKDCRWYETPVQSTKNDRSKKKAVRLPLVLNPRAAGVRERPRVDDHAGGGFFLKPLALSRALDTRDAFEEAAELAALLLFGLCGSSQPESDLAVRLTGAGQCPLAAG